MPFLLLAIAIAPCIGVSVFVYFKDKYEKEPLQLLLKCFFLGAFSVFPSSLLEILADRMGLGVSTNLVLVATYAFCVVALSEEWCKYMFLRWFAYPKDDFNEPFDGIMYSVMISMGFATVENIFYVMQGGVEVGLVRMFLSVPAHGTFAVLMGYFVGLSKFQGHKRFLRFAGLGSATFFHGFFDFFLIQQNYHLLSLGALAGLGIAVWLSMKAIRTAEKLSPFRSSR